MAGAATRNGEIPAFAGMTGFFGGPLPDAGTHACRRLPEYFFEARPLLRPSSQRKLGYHRGGCRDPKRGDPSFRWDDGLAGGGWPAPCRTPVDSCLHIFFGARPLSRPSSQRKLGYHRGGRCDPERGDPSFRWDDSLRERSPAQIEAVCSPAKAGAQSGSPPSRGNTFRSVGKLTRRRVRRGRSGPWR